MRFPTVCLMVLATAALPSIAGAAQDCGSSAYECAAFHASRGQFGEAIRLVEQMLAQAPTDLKALNLAGIALTGLGRIDEANARFREAVRLDSRFYPALKNLAINEFSAGRLEEAERHFEAVLILAPGDEVAHVHLGEIAFDRKNSAGALAHYENAGARIAQNPVWTLHYGSCLLDQHQLDRAVAVLDALPRADADNRFDAGMILGKSGAYADAARFFGSARERYKDPGAAGYNQALMLVEAGDYDAAVRVAQEMVDRGLPSSELYNLTARAHEKAGRVKEAYDALRAATKIAPAAEENYVDLASICLDHQNFDLGLEIIDIGLQHRPDSSLLHLQRGVLMAMRAQLGPAEAEFDAARRLAPDAPAPYAGLAMIWMQTGQTDRAVDVLRQQARARRDHVVPYIFAVALMRSGVDPAGPGAAEAVAALQASIDANPRFAPSHSELGRLLLKRDDLAGAIRELETATALDAENTAAIYNLAQAYRRKGDRARAADLLARVTKLNAQERGDDPAADLKRTVLRIVRDGPAPQP